MWDYREQQTGLGIIPRGKTHFTMNVTLITLYNLALPNKHLLHCIWFSIICNWYDCNLFIGSNKILQLAGSKLGISSQLECQSLCTNMAMHSSLLTTNSLYSLFQFERSNVISVLKNLIECSFVFFKCFITHNSGDWNCILSLYMEKLYEELIMCIINEFWVVVLPDKLWILQRSLQFCFCIWVCNSGELKSSNSECTWKCSADILLAIDVKLRLCYMIQHFSLPKVIEFFLRSFKQ